MDTESTAIGGAASRLERFIETGDEAVLLEGLESLGEPESCSCLGTGNPEEGCFGPCYDLCGCDHCWSGWKLPDGASIAKQDYKGDFWRASIRLSGTAWVGRDFSSFGQAYDWLEAQAAQREWQP